MDRHLKHGVLGLCLAWLKRGSARNCVKATHALDKISLSQHTAFSERESARDELTAMGMSDAALESLIQLEASIRGGDLSEPESVFLRVGETRLFEAMASDLGTTF